MFVPAVFALSARWSTNWSGYGRHTISRVSSVAALRSLRRLLGEIAPDAGDRLPSERALATMLACSRETARKGLATLEAEGEIWRHVGQGAFRGARPLDVPIRDSLLVEGATPRDLMRARILFEPQVAAEAARRARASDIAHLRSKVEAGRNGANRSECERADDAFHLSLAQTSRNPVLVGLLGYLSGARRRAAWQREWDRTYRRIGVDEFRSIHSAQHAEVVDKIAASNPPGAAAAMAAHLDTIMAAIEDGS